MMQHCGEQKFSKDFQNFNFTQKLINRSSYAIFVCAKPCMDDIVEVFSLEKLSTTLILTNLAVNYHL